MLVPGTMGCLKLGEEAVSEWKISRTLSQEPRTRERPSVLIVSKSFGGSHISSYIRSIKRSGDRKFPLALTT